MKLNKSNVEENKDLLNQNLIEKFEDGISRTILQMFNTHRNYDMAYMTENSKWNIIFLNTIYIYIYIKSE